MASDDLYDGGGGGYYGNPLNYYTEVEENNNDDDDGWFYPEGDDAQSFYDQLMNNPVQWYGNTPTEIEAEPIEEPRYDYSGYMEYSTNNDESYDDSYTSQKSEAQKPVAAPEPEQQPLEVTTVEEPKMGYTWTEVQPAAQPEQASVDQGFVTRMQNSVGQDEDQSKFYSGNPVSQQQQEEAPARSFMDRVMSIGTTPVYGESQTVTPQPLNLPLGNMEAIQYGIDRTLQPVNLPLSNMQAMQYGIGQSMAMAPVPAGQIAASSAVPNNPLSAAGAPNLFQGGSYLPATQAPRAAMVPYRAQMPEIQPNPFSFGFNSPVSVPFPEQLPEQQPSRRMVLTSRPLTPQSAEMIPTRDVQPSSPFITGQTPMSGLPEMQMRDYGYQNTPTINTELPEAEVSPVNPVNYYGPENHLLGAGPREFGEENTAPAAQAQRYTGEIMNPLSVEDYFASRLGDVQQTPAFQEGNYEYDFRYGDPRNIPPEQMADTVYKMTGDSDLADQIQQEYEKLKAVGLNNRQISADLARLAKRNDGNLEQMEKQDAIRSLMNPDGSLNYDYSIAQKGWLPDEVAVPGVDQYGRYNQALEYILTPILEYNEDGTPKLDKDGNQVVHYPFNSPADILHMWEKVITDGSTPTKYTQNGEGFRGLSEAVLNDPTISKFLATSPYGSILQGSIKDGGTIESVKATKAEWDQALEKFIINTPALQQLINKGLLTKADIAAYFFKKLDLTEEKEKTTKKSGGGGGGRGSSSSSGGRRGGGGGYGSSGGTTNPPVANQKMSRIFNIMKNWSF